VGAVATTEHSNLPPLTSHLPRCPPLPWRVAPWARVLLSLKRGTRKPGWTTEPVQMYIRVRLARGLAT
jgi:hypothetical protein